MEAVIRKWGNSPALRLPSAALKEAGFALELKVGAGRLTRAFCDPALGQRDLQFGCWRGSQTGL